MNLKELNTVGVRHHPLTFSVNFEYSYEHKHLTWEIMLLITGESVSTVNGVPHKMKSGCAMILSPNHIHRCEVKDVKNYEHRDIYLENQIMERICGALNPCLYESLLNENPVVFNIPNDLLMAVDRRLKALQTLDPRQITNDDLSVHYSIAAYFIGLYVENRKKNNPSNYPEWLSHILIEMNKPEVLAGNLNHIIELSNYSHEHLCRLFKKYTGTKLITYFTKQKMYRALTLLLDTDFSIVKIANEVGYSSLSFFIKVFKETFGSTPMKYKNRLLKNNS